MRLEIKSNEEIVKEFRKAWQESVGASVNSFKTPIIDELAKDVVDWYKNMLSFYSTLSVNRVWVEGSKINVDILFRPIQTYIDITIPFDCECGADKHGFASHSTWCPKHG